MLLVWLQGHVTPLRPGPVLWGPGGRTRALRPTSLGPSGGQRSLSHCARPRCLPSASLSTVKDPWVLWGPLGVQATLPLPGQKQNQTSSCPPAAVLSWVNPLGAGPPCLLAFPSGVVSLQEFWGELYTPLAYSGLKAQALKFVFQQNKRNTGQGAPREAVPADPLLNCPAQHPRVGNQA